MITQKIYEWAKVRGILEASADAQLGRLIEEAGEVAKEIRTNNIDGIIDELGDMAVVALNHYAIVNGKAINADIPDELKGYGAYVNDRHVLGLCDVLSNTRDGYHQNAILELAILSELLTNKPLSYCLEYAYNKIKDRRGMMVNGSYVKEADFINRGITVDWDNLTDQEAERARILFLEG